MDIKTEWHGKAFMDRVMEDLQINLKKAGFYGVNQLKVALNRGQPTRRTASGRLIGLDPSLPGEFPKKVTGNLQRSMAFVVADDKLTIGSNLKKPPYPIFLQYGTRKMAPRPWMSLFWRAHNQAIARIILTGQ